MRGYLARNHVALLAMLAALGGPAYAAGTIGSDEVIDDSLRSVDVRDREIRSEDVRDAGSGGELKAVDIADGSLTGADIAEDRLTGVIAECGAGAIAGSAVVNAGSSVPATFTEDFVDGFSCTGGAPTVRRDDVGVYEVCFAGAEHEFSVATPLNTGQGSAGEDDIASVRKLAAEGCEADGAGGGDIVEVRIVDDGGAGPLARQDTDFSLVIADR